MGSVKDAAPAGLVAGVTFTGEEVLDQARHLLEDTFGPVAFESAAFSFDMTDYYTAEMGAGLSKLFLCFERPIDIESLPAVKHTTNELEMKLAFGDPRRPSRRVNIDPGYVTLSKLVLATTKDYSHRIYIGGGMYAEVTLKFLENSFEPHETTYPDYRTPLALEFFNRVRDYVKRNEALWSRTKK